MTTKAIDIAGSISSAVVDVTKEWAKQRKAEERDRARRFRRYDYLVRDDRVTIRDAAWDVMEEAYAKASDNGRLPVRPRQIMYAARPEILALTGKDHLDDRYFTQTLLPDYLKEYPKKCESWDVVWDARGHFSEPHTGHEIGLGTLEVREYLGLRAERHDAVTVDRSTLYPTLGPEHRFTTILFIEKEGFGPLFAAEHLAERYDLAIMSTKGMSVTAARLLLDRLTERGIERILVLHDFDVSGFSIFGTLGTSGRRYCFDNKIAAFDVGLRLADVEAMDLQSEPVAVTGGEKCKWTLRRHGARPEEIAFLWGRRVELNAMTSPQLIAFVEDKLRQHGVEKLVPDDATLTQHARRLIEQQLAAAEVGKLRAKLSRAAARTPLPADLRQAVEQRLAAVPQLSWDAALAELLRSEGGLRSS
jgi:hypothetical protein